MAAIRSVPSTNTFEALTEFYTPRRLIDNIFTGTPLLNWFRRNMVQAAGIAWTPIVEIAKEDGEWYDRGDQVGTPTTITGEIATRAVFYYQFYRRKVLLEAQDTDGQGAQKLIDLMNAQVRNATKSMQTNLNNKLFSGNPAANPAEINSLDVALDNLNTWGGLNGNAAGYYQWQAHMMVGEDTFATPVAPSLQNISKMIQSILLTTGEKPTAIFVAEPYWDVLRAQVGENQYLIANAARANSDVVKWGFDALWVDGVPVVPDRECLGSAWVPGQATRADAAGYQAFFVNFKYMKMAYNPARAFKWDPDGWRRPDDYDRYLNYLYFWGTIGSDQRRAHGRIMNVCLDTTLLPVADWKLGTVHIPGNDPTP